MANTVFRDSAGEVMLVTTNKKLFDGINSGKVNLVIGDDNLIINNYKYKEVDRYKIYHLKLRERIKNDETCELLEEYCTFIKSNKNNGTK